MKYAIITGASRGLGNATAKKLIEKGYTLFCISRKQDMEIVKKAYEKNVELNYYEFDLSNVELIEGLMDDVFEKISAGEAESLYLINNASVVSPLRPISKCESGSIIKNIKVDLLAPIILISTFIRLSEKMEIQKRIVNISSGAAYGPMHGAACYCSAKAGIEMLTKCVGIEEEGKEHPVKVMSFTPGIMDTEMQREVRSSNEQDFAELKRFKNYKKKGMLTKPEIVAEKVVKLIECRDFKQGESIDVSDIE
ncbi:benzil reductase ((S)-benzoin forming) [Peptoclostridium litorale DSM 5388]|uniref:Short-chain dehydrogenase/reductase SDR n=1 Tax=Peptoclostridium litorale DSM 5388 TaxID=1121324 RepID=A0A069RMI7_PEPLI|nr:(S)-benzoin forming benzil reductase [Peptoclostridium litorale]KDR95407.1 short-chain dehydrogenase/reductase SDR [Peptoclostridium litorale DSM 5388]SIO19420.1 benzil reductase ((S)-benzoin forming) [Peptoclostridium litorale DSM 5388]